MKIFGWLRPPKKNGGMGVINRMYGEDVFMTILKTRPLAAARAPRKWLAFLRGGAENCG